MQERFREGFQSPRLPGERPNQSGIRSHPSAGKWFRYDGQPGEAPHQEDPHSGGALETHLQSDSSFSDPLEKELPDPEEAPAEPDFALL